jgi:predicted signal transduction protein with EAL and GGDEF domain
MRKFNSGHRTRVSMVLALTVLVVGATAYGLGATESWRGTLAVALAAGTLLALSWMLVGVLRQKEERLQHRTFHDPLTNLPNRSKFMEHVREALERSARRSRSIAVLVVDLDDFEEINHSLGHEAGDRLLAVAGERLEGGRATTSRSRNRVKRCLRS